MHALPKGYSVSKRLGRSEMDDLYKIVFSAPFVLKVLDSMPEMVAVLTDTRQLVVANDAMLVFLGISKGDFIPGPRPGEILSCVHAHKSEFGCGNSEYCAQCGAFNTIVQAIAQGERATGECRITLEKSGRAESLDLYLWCAPFEVQGRQFSILAAVDISDRKRRLALERVFFHDVLNTMQPLMGFVDLLQDVGGERMQQIYPTLKKATQTLREEILSHRDLLLAENDSLSVKGQSIQSRVLLNKLITIHGDQAQAMGVRLVISPEAESVAFTGDGVLISRVIGNMLKNALEASRTGQEVTMGSRVLGGEIELFVHNQAFMPLKVSHQVFQRSFSTKSSSRGLGTYSMRLLTERYLEGRVFFKSTPDGGTTFFARYPVKPSYAF